MKHMREQFTQQITEVQDEVVAILADVSLSVRAAVASLVNGDHEAALAVIQGDDLFDQRTLAVEERVNEIIATQYPVARDLRLLQSMVVIAFHEERMADLAASIAKCAVRTHAKRGPQTLYDLIQAQGNLVYRVVDTTHEALLTRDLELALKLPELDEPIDHLYKQFFRELSRLHDEEDIEWASKMVLATRYLERIADNAVDIGERIAYIITGERDLVEPEDTAASIRDAMTGPDA